MGDRANVWNSDGGEFPSNEHRCSAMWGKNNFVFQLLLGRRRRRRQSRQMQIEFLLPIRNGRRWVCTSRTHFGQNHRHHWCLPLRELFENFICFAFFCCCLVLVLVLVLVHRAYAFLCLCLICRSLTIRPAKLYRRLFRSLICRTHSIAKWLCKLRSQKCIGEFRSFADNGQWEMPNDFYLLMQRKIKSDREHVECLSKGA